MGEALLLKPADRHTDRQTDRQTGRQIGQDKRPPGAGVEIYRSNLGL